MAISTVFRILSLLSVFSLIFAADVLLGELSDEAGHGLAGTVYAVDTKTLRIEGFKYDGQGPAGVYWIDEGPTATGAGVIALDGDTCEAVEQLPEFTGEDVVVELPEGRELDSVGYFSVWCEVVGMSFGGVTVDESKLKDLPKGKPKCAEESAEEPAEEPAAPSAGGKEVLIGELTDEGGHGVGGTVYAVDSRTLRIDGFTYDGKGPAGVYWVDETLLATAQGLAALDQTTCEAVDRLPEFKGEEVFVELPIDISKVFYFSIWCETVGVSFGGVSFDPDVVKDVPQAEPKCTNDAAPAADVQVELGKLSDEEGHGLAGTVYAINSRTLKIEGFKYDGEGPAGAYWIDEGSEATATGVSAFDQETCLAERLPEFTGQDIFVELPEGRELSSVGYFSIWCETVGVSFGGVAVDPKKVADLPVVEPKCSKSESEVADKEVKVGKLSNLAEHGVGGTVFALNSRTLRVKNFKYNGEGPAAVFWVGTGKPDGSGAIPLFREDCSVSEKLPAFSGDQVDLALPDDLELSSIEYLSVWCEEVGVDFGSVSIDASALKGVPELQSPSCASDSGAEEESEPFPVQDNFNCEELNKDFQVRWAIAGDNLNVELVGRIGGDEYMGFGPSGSDRKTDMIGSDVAIAYQDGDEFAAVDYFMNGRNPCTAGKGVCPDEDLGPKSGTNDISDISGKKEGDLTMIRYSRPLSASDKDFDKPISTSTSMFVSWATGPLNPSAKLPLFHQAEMSFPTSDVEIEFGRTVSNACETKLVVSGEAGDAVPGFERPTIHGVAKITARIGPPGGTRGYSGITGGPSWGFAWYMSPTGEMDKDVLIPAIGVERGKTYTFTVQGGVDDGSGNAFHPLYITSSPMGGFAARTPEERAEETVYAGIEDIVTDSDGSVTSFSAPGVGALCDITTSLEGDSASVKSWADYFKTLDISCAKDDSVTSKSGELIWTVPADAPDELYYQCVTHPFLGYKIVVFDEAAVDEDLLKEMNGGGTLKEDGSTDADGDDEDQSDVEGGGKKLCTATFKGEEKQFDGCQKGLDGDMDLYWKVRQADGEIDTLFRAPTEGGYVGFGWGYSEMVGSHVVIAYADPSGEGVIDSYFLEAKSTEGVQPNDTLNLIEKDVEVEGESVTGFFVRKLEIDGIPTIAREETSAIWAVGAQPESPTALTQHQVRSPGVFDLSSPVPDGEQTVDDDDTTATPEDDTALVPEDEEAASSSPEDEGDSNGAGTGRCRTAFRGEEREFDGCEKGLDGDVDVYWSLREEDGEVDTLFRAPTEGGYVGFGWGYSEMVGSHVVIAYADPSGEGVIDSYFLEAKSTEGVQPNDTLNLIEKDVEVEGESVTGFFVRKLEIDGIPTIAREETSAIWAVGAQPESPTALTIHRVRSPGVFDLSSPVQEGDSSEDGEAGASPEGDGMEGGNIEDGEGAVATPEDAGDCVVSFKGEDRSFAGCQKDLDGNVDVYWTLRETEGEIDTLFRAPTDGGYVGFGWGYSQMVGSHVVIAFADAAGDGAIDTYFMESKSSDGVQPNETLQLVNKEVDVAGGFVTGIFTRKLEVDGVSTLSNGVTSAVWAVGAQPSSPDNLTQHTARSPELFDLSAGSGAIPEADVEGDVNCTVTFNGEEKVFGGCRKNLEHDCEVYWTIREDDGEIDTLFRARIDGYVGFGWGYSEMVDSDVVIALQDANGEVQIGDYRMQSKSTEGVQPKERQGLTNTDAAIDGEYLAGMFTRSLEVDGLPVIRNGQTEAIWAVGGRPDSRTSLTQHGGRASGRIDLSQSAGDVDGQGAAAYDIVHGVLMAVAWLILTPTAMTVMRYLKGYHPLTFQTHRALNVLSVTLVVAAFIMGLVRGSRTETAHLVIGCIVFSLALLQVLGGVLRPKKNSNVRKPWSFVHLVSGYATHGLGMANVWIGLGVINAARGYYIATGVLVGLYVLVQLVFGFMPRKFPVRERDEQFPDEPGPPVAGVPQGPELT